jgi:tetratricopeptide (TPR) repeat protein
VSPSRQQSDQLRLARQADLNYRAGKYEAARKQYESLLAMNPGFSVGQVRLGVIAYGEGDAKTARSHFERALQHDPQNTQASFNLAMLHLTDATRLLGTYINESQATAQRERVQTLLDQIKAFGSKP